MPRPALTLLQWNVQWCRGINGRVDAARIASVAEEIADPDIACFQEVGVNFAPLAGSSGEDQVALLRELFPGYQVFFGYGVDVPDDLGGRRLFGNLVLTRLPVRRVQRHSLPWPADPDKPSMPRIAIEALIEAPFGPLRVTTTHLEYYSGVQRSAQVERLRELHAEACARVAAAPSARYQSGPFAPLGSTASAIVTGDFNLPPQDPMYARMLAPFEEGTPRLLDAWHIANPGVAHPPTFCLHGREHGAAPYCCDFAFVTEDLAPRVRSVRIDRETQASDHQPVVLELT